MPENGAIQKDSSGTYGRRIGEIAGAHKGIEKTPAPSPSKSGIDRAGGLLIWLGGGIPFGISLYVACTWWWWQDWKMGAAADTVPMAPGAALILMILGGALLLRQGLGEKPVVRVIGFLAAAIAAAPAILLGLHKATGVEVAWEDLLPHAHAIVRGIPLGYLSLFQPARSCLAAVSLADAFPAAGRTQAVRSLGAGHGFAWRSLSIVVILAYASGTLLFYSESRIPMSMLTGSALAALNLALLTAASRDSAGGPKNAGAPHLHPTPSWRGRKRNSLIVIGVLAFGIALTGLVFLRVQQAALRERITDQLGRLPPQGQPDRELAKRAAGGCATEMQTPSLARIVANYFANPDSAASVEKYSLKSRARNDHHYEAVVFSTIG